MSEQDIISEIVSRRNRARDEKIRRGQSELFNEPVVRDAYNFYRGIEYELNKLLGWLGYEE